jgi:hypothetical protein
MNKKLFSWKALAGLALLVAMGLTSCQQGAEVDPTDPYKPKPVTPGSSTKGGDLVLTITNTADLASLWDSYDATKKAELMKKTTLNIVINAGSYKLDGSVLTLPKFFNTPANSVLNLTFNGNFQDADKQPLRLDASTNLSGAKVNIVLPSQAFNMNLNSTNVAATLSSEGAATIGTFLATGNTNKNNALTIGSGVTIKAIDDASTGAILVNGGAINALIVNAAPTYKKEKGFKIGSEETYTTNLIINTTGLTITNDEKTPLGDITINKNCDLKLGFKNATVNSITGTKASEGILTLSGDADDLKNISAIKNVEIKNGGKDLNVAKNIFNGVKISENVNLTAAAIADVEISGNISIDFNANNMTFAFTSVNFGGAIIPAGGIKTTQTPTKTTYQWDINNNKWVVVTGAIFPANAGDSGIEVSANDVTVSGGAITKGADKIGDHKVFTIVTENSVKLKPENALVTLDKCKKSGADLNDANVSTIFGWTGFGWLGDPWFKVSLNGKLYSWKESSVGYTLIAD